MRTAPSLLAALTALVLTASACGSDADEVAEDPGSSPTTASSAPPAPLPDGPVRTRDLAVVMDTGSPELCLGPVAESYPPQCGGPALTGWDWEGLGQGMYDQEGEVRWGSFLVTGDWDGTAFAATDAVPAALYDPASPEPTPTPSPATAYSDAELERIAQELLELVPDAQGAYGGQGADGHVLVDVFYDDGTLQAWADDAYGEGVVLVTSALVDAD